MNNNDELLDHDVSEDSIDEGIYEGISDDEEEEDDEAMEEDNSHPNANVNVNAGQGVGMNPHLNTMAYSHGNVHHPHANVAQDMMASHQHPHQHQVQHQHRQHIHGQPVQVQHQVQLQQGHAPPHQGNPHGHAINHMQQQQSQQQQQQQQQHVPAQGQVPAVANPAATDPTGPADTNQQNSSSTTASLEMDSEPNLEGYERTDRIGQGAYGIVYRGVQRSTGVTVAIKRIPFADAAPEGGVPCNVIREISLLRELDHPNVVRLLDVNQAKPGELYLVFEYVAHDLKTFLDKSQSSTEGSGRQGLPPHVVRSFMRQILEGVGYCHTYRILHRDLKPHNVSSIDMLHFAFHLNLYCDSLKENSKFSLSFDIFDTTFMYCVCN